MTISNTLTQFDSDFYIIPTDSVNLSLQTFLSLQSLICSCAGDQKTLCEKTVHIYESYAESSYWDNQLNSIITNLMNLNSLKNKKYSLLDNCSLRLTLLKIERLIPNLFDLKVDQDKVDDLVNVFFILKKGIIEEQLPPPDSPSPPDHQKLEKFREFKQNQEAALLKFRAKFLQSVPKEWDMDSFFKIPQEKIKREASFADMSKSVT